MKRILVLLSFSSFLSVFAHANNLENTHPEKMNGDSLRVKPSSSFQGLIFFSFPKADGAVREEDVMKD